ncbi:ATP phosphoribosyltransferase regulatory subunit [Bacillus sp. FJAT-49711]|uniref:ATP phosphoribosyltransferase regulatory subunit n=1 Tax=Bacillus sp. FJAT-49711 TaxID=2833585 RepID=UPI001BC8D035|nr:ATP phosphoribosyltransferase regulatory subunit [Bacillus sp. FJAT-49711]MBS4220372.1 ATP phosphoribosyltransferase regulatory subunit [Bacillus sp. FJAT-49711]
MFLPAGSKDEIGTSLNNRFQVMEKFRQITMMRGYKPISTPVIEYASTFTNEFIDMKLQDMMKWFDSEGEIEVLRPDWTTAIARALSTQEKKPQKWAYQGSIFKRNMPGVEYHQIGVEILHHPELMGESECLLMAQAFLKEIGVGTCVIELGHTEIYESLVSELQLSKVEAERLRQAMHDKKKDEVYQIALAHSDQEKAEEIASLVDAFGPIEIIAEYEERWKERENVLGTLRHIKKLAHILQQSGSGEILVDLGRVKNLPYYSGLMFRGFLQSSGAICFSGGRYDRLYEQFGESISAVGIALDVEVLAAQVKETKSLEKVCIIANEESLAFAENVRESFQNCIVDVQSDSVNVKDYDQVYEIKNLNGKFEVIER